MLKPCLLLSATWLLLAVTDTTLAYSHTYVGPTGSQGTECHATTCHPLSDILQNAEKFFTSDATITLLPGNYVIDNNASSGPGVIEVSNVRNLTLTGGGTEYGSQLVTIECTTPFSFLFSNTSQLTIANLQFADCTVSNTFPGAENVYAQMLTAHYSHHFIPTAPDSLGALFLLNNVTDFDISGISVTGINGSALVALYISGRARVSHSVFANNPAMLPGTPAVLLHIGEHNTNSNISIMLHDISIANSPNSLGLVVGDECCSPTTNSSDVSLPTNSSGNRQACCNLQHSVSISESSFVDLLTGVIVHFFLSTVAIVDSAIRSNRYGVLAYNSVLDITDTNVTHNKVALHATECSNTTFNGRVIIEENICGLPPSGAVTLQMNSVLVLNGQPIFRKNSCGSGSGAIFAQRAFLVFRGNATFEQNTGFIGGAIAMQGGARMVINSTNTQVYFIANHAQAYGGAIYAKNNNCFFDLPLLENQRIHAVNNTAELGGSVVYGGSVNKCISPDNNTNVFNALFQFDQPPDPSLVSSEPTTVCFCKDSEFNCSQLVYRISAYPGQRFSIPVVPVGQETATTTGLVLASLLETPASLGKMQRAQLASQYCTYLNYTLRTDKKEEWMVLTTFFAPVNLFMADQDEDTFFYDTSSIPPFPHLVNVQLLDCSAGFQLINGMCQCATQLQTQDITCNIDEQTVVRPALSWIGIVPQHSSDNTSNGDIVVHHTCPPVYCKDQTLELNLTQGDQQCRFNHTGILCGACKDGLSSLLGSSRCKKCSNMWLLLLIPFALAGVLLVIVLAILNITVSVGTINGLIFYANIIKANRHVFFPAELTGLNRFLSVFIAWINLDLEIETCFYDSLDPYALTWLQFAFPIYVWIIVITIIVSSHYSTKIAKLAPKNMVPVLATLFLLSYAKLLRTAITALSFTVLQFSDGSTRPVWLYDGNIPYLQGKHIPLFLAALLVLLSTSIPYTLILLFVQCLQRKTQARALNWTRKLKPLFDAYTAPYKDRHRYWLGLTLVVRATLFLIFSINVTGTPAINLFAIHILGLLLLVTSGISGGVYKSLPLNILESFFLTNLEVFTGATFYGHLTDRYGTSQPVVVDAMVGSAFAVFVGIVFYHCVVTLRLSSHAKQVFQAIFHQLQRSLKPKASNSENIQSSTITVSLEQSAQQEAAPLMTSSICLREPVLEYV